MAQQSWLCTTCGRTQASNFCTCTTPETFLCNDCFQPHYNKQRIGVMHSIAPVQCYGEHKLPGYFQRLQARVDRIPTAKAELLGSLAKVDTCMAEFTRKVEEMYALLAQFTEKKWAELQQYRVDLERRINESIEEVERTIYQDNPHFTTPFAIYLRTDSAELPDFSYQFGNASFDDFLNNILTKPKGGLRVGCKALNTITGIFGNSLNIYDSNGQVIKSATLSRSFDTGTVYCTVSNGSVLCIGAWPATSNVFSLNLTDYVFTPLTPMKTARGYPGILSYGDFIYIFGGNNPAISACEKYSITSRSWTQLTNMSYPRYAFSPCEFEGEVYLADFYQTHKSFETFNLKSEQFKVLPISLSAFSQANSVSCIFEGEFFTYTHSNMTQPDRVG